MGDYVGLVFLVMTGVSIYTLARADRWSRFKAIGISLFAVATPLVVAVKAYSLATPIFVSETLLTISFLIAPIVIFGFAKSIAKKVEADA
ncbi:hypothetical protein [uncultured Roseobacter sp.]|uniref:hypothetical protein n=1 Tax=uncultured Roseobacter sp. TaxID=114847 RepID=UPI0026210DC5|nr:hypothetical protein [uncultured Roseobacter sp.]